jgi:DNA-binding CsgD family transcriptional regulator
VVATISGAPRFGAILGRSSDAVFVVGPGFRIVEWGPRAERLLRVPATRAVGRRCFDLFAGSQAMGRNICGPTCWAARALRHGQTVPAFCMDLCLAGGERRALTLGFVVDDSGEFLAHIFRERQPAGSLPAEQSSVTTDPARYRGRAEPASLTHRQLQVLQLIMSGATSLEVARSLGVTHATARNHVQNLLVTLGVHSRLEAALLAQRIGLPFEAEGAVRSHSGTE